MRVVACWRGRHTSRCTSGSSWARGRAWRRFALAQRVSVDLPLKTFEPSRRRTDLLVDFFQLGFTLSQLLGDLLPDQLALLLLELSQVVA